jgi:hypothetical protein
MKLAPMSLYAWTLAPLILLHIWMFFRHRSCFRFQLLLDVVLLVVMAPAWVRNADLNPVKCIQGSPPFKHVQWSPQTQFQPTQSDLAYYFHPWWELAGRQIARGKMPELAAEVGAGLPLLANGQIGLWPALVGSGGGWHWMGGNAVPGGLAAGAVGLGRRIFALVVAGVVEGHGTARAVVEHWRAGGCMWMAHGRRSASRDHRHRLWLGPARGSPAPPTEV